MTSEEEYQKAINDKLVLIRERTHTYNLHLKKIRRELKKLREEYKRFLKANKQKPIQ